MRIISEIKIPWEWDSAELSTACRIRNGILSMTGRKEKIKP